MNRICLLGMLIVGVSAVGCSSSGEGARANGNTAGTRKVTEAGETGVDEAAPAETGGRSSDAGASGQGGETASGGSSSSTGCKQGLTRLCVGPGACDGGQECLPTGLWSHCDCGESAGGAASSAGAPAMGGEAAEGGAAKSSGGATSAGGTVGAGGDKPNGGATADSGSAGGSGGATSAGGAVGAGGDSEVDSSGGSTVIDPGPLTSPDCTDTATDSGTFATQFGSTPIAVIGAEKEYYLYTNWWGAYDGQTVSYKGLSFTVGNPSGGDLADSNTPMGYPAFFIGSYSGHATKGSNLPISVNEITAIPTIFSSNAADGDTSNYNAVYDVWLTADNAPLGANDYSPGNDGAYLMVWMFKPENRQPRGSKKDSDITVEGVEGQWDVWVEQTEPPCVSYVSHTPRNGLAFDLISFIREAVDSERGVYDTMYLSTIFAGFEIWGGGDGLEVKNFCVNVQ
jgi:hypothetical protein